MKESSLFQRACPVKLILLLIVSLLPLAASFAEEPAQPKIREKNGDGRLEVLKAKMNGYFIDIQLRVHGRSGDDRISADYPRNVFVIEESTGEKFFARRFTRIGTLGQKHLAEGIISSVRIDNVGMKVKKDSRITVVVGELRQAHIIVEDDLRKEERRSK